MASAVALTAGLLSVSTAPLAGRGDQFHLRGGRSGAAKRSRPRSSAGTRVTDCASARPCRCPLDYDKPQGREDRDRAAAGQGPRPEEQDRQPLREPGRPGRLGHRDGPGRAVLPRATSCWTGSTSSASTRAASRFSDNVKCFQSAKDQTRAYAGHERHRLPVRRKKQEAAYVKSAKARRQGLLDHRQARSPARCRPPRSPATWTCCAARSATRSSPTWLQLRHRARPVLRQHVPGPVPRVAVDGVIDPTTWVGTSKTARAPIQDDRLRSADGAYKALIEILKRCDAAGRPSTASFAAGNPVANFEKIAAQPADQAASWSATRNSATSRITYADFVGTVLGALYGPYAGECGHRAGRRAAGADLSGTPAEATAGAKAALVKRVKQARAKPGRDFPYDNVFEALLGCDVHRRPAPEGRGRAGRPRSPSPTSGRRTSAAPGPGAARSAPATPGRCEDEDAYTGPFTKRTTAPVLVVGSYWDPATNYDEAVSSAKLLPNSRLLSSNNWGHTAYGTSACATGAIDTYLLLRALPRARSASVTTHRSRSSSNTQSTSQSKALKARTARIHSAGQARPAVSHSRSRRKQMELIHDPCAGRRHPSARAGSSRRFLPAVPLQGCRLP